MKPRILFLSGLLTLLSLGLLVERSAAADGPAIDCPHQPVAAYLCDAAEACAPLAIAHADSVQTSFGDWQDGQLCFRTDTTGVYGIVVTAFGAGGETFCELTVVVIEDCPEVATSVEPDTIHLLDLNILPSLSARLVLTVDAASYDATDIDPTTLTINSGLIPDSAVLLSGTGTGSPALGLFFSLSKFTHGYGLLIDTVATTYQVSGKFRDGRVIETTGLVTLVGYLSGDVNLDGSVDISDLMYLIDYLFQSGPPPPIPEPADLDGSGGADISDLMILINRMFGV